MEHTYIARHAGKEPIRTIMEKGPVSHALYALLDVQWQGIVLRRRTLNVALVSTAITRKLSPLTCFPIASRVLSAVGTVKIS